MLGEEGGVGQLDVAGKDGLDFGGRFGQEWLQQRSDIEQRADLIGQDFAQVIRLTRLGDGPRLFLVNVLVEAADLLPDFVERPVKSADRQGGFILRDVVSGFWQVADFALLVLLIMATVRWTALPSSLASSLL